MDLVGISRQDLNTGKSDHLLLAYVADLELEVDRLRKHGQYLRHSVADALVNIRDDLGHSTSADETPARVSLVLDELTAMIRDLDDPPGYHPAHDQVIAIAVRPLVEQVFRWQQRLLNAAHATLHMDLSTETINWFPARFRHIVDNLLSNALRYRDSAKGESRVSIFLNHRTEAIELRVTDNGLGMPSDKRISGLELFYRSAPVRNANPGVGLAVVKLIIEQSGGSFSVDSGEGKGSNFTVVLPRYDVGDYLS